MGGVFFIFFDTLDQRVNVVVKEVSFLMIYLPKTKLMTSITGHLRQTKTIWHQSCIKVSMHFDSESEWLVWRGH